VHKIVFPASIVASAATAFGLGALAFNSPNAPAASTPLPRATVTAPANVADDAETVADDTAPSSTPTTAQKPAQGPSSATTKAKHAKPTATPEKPAQKATTPKHAKPTKAGDAGPFKDAQGDGKHLDDVVKTVLPGVSVGVHIPDAMLPFPGPGYTGKPSSIDTQEDADNAPLAYNPDDVVSGPNIITDPDKPWFHFPTSPVTEPPVSSTPVVSTPVETPVPAETTEPVRTGGLVTGTRPHWG
jgi:hypothetical protein